MALKDLQPEAQGHLALLIQGQLQELLAHAEQHDELAGMCEHVHHALTAARAAFTSPGAHQPGEQSAPTPPEVGVPQADQPPAHTPINPAIATEAELQASGEAHHVAHKDPMQEFLHGAHASDPHPSAPHTPGEMGHHPPAPPAPGALGQQQESMHGTGKAEDESRKAPEDEKSHGRMESRRATERQQDRTKG
jgi:hypothetical protein